uniref:Uncharacterized protein n=1 Tax=Anguilla anguilla TaxID=7936 RepID=A0A0E9RRU7_ANGAN
MYQESAKPPVLKGLASSKHPQAIYSVYNHFK